jgi:hypothetical protein
VGSRLLGRVAGQLRWRGGRAAVGDEGDGWRRPRPTASLRWRSGRRRQDGGGARDAGGGGLVAATKNGDGGAQGEAARVGRASGQVGKLEDRVFVKEKSISSGPRKLCRAKKHCRVPFSEHTAKNLCRVL